VVLQRGLQGLLISIYLGILLDIPFYGDCDSRGLLAFHEGNDNYHFVLMQQSLLKKSSKHVTTGSWKYISNILNHFLLNLSIVTL